MAVIATIRFSNRNPAPFFIQVEPWAGIYRLKEGEAIEFVAKSESLLPEFDIHRDGDTQHLTIVHSSEYYVVLNGRHVHWSKYPNNGPWD